MNYNLKALGMTTLEQQRKLYLASHRTEQALLACQWWGRLRDVYHPITLDDGTYWRNGNWNKPRGD